jgi:hypothetical protein
MTYSPEDITELINDLRALRDNPNIGAQFVIDAVFLANRATNVIEALHLELTKSRVIRKQPPPLIFDEDNT